MKKNIDHGITFDLKNILDINAARIDKAKSLMALGKKFTTD